MTTDASQPGGTLTAPRAIEESGTFFVLPPHHRLFAVFDDPVVGSEVAAALRADGTAEDVWTFFGDQGVKSLDPRVASHGVPVGIVRVIQRVLTNDCEYCDALTAALRHGAMVLAARVDASRVDELSERIAESGGHSFAYGAHYNFVPLAAAPHAVGYFSAEEPEREAATDDEAASETTTEAANGGDGAVLGAAVEGVAGAARGSANANIDRGLVERRSGPEDDGPGARHGGGPPSP